MNNNIPYSPSRLDSTNYLIKYMPKYLLSNKRLIDVGCGKLYFFDLLPYLRFSGSYLGIDIDPKKPDSVHKDIDWKVLKANILKFETNKKFDIAVCLWVLEHIRDDNKAIERIYKILKPGGILVIAVPSIWTWPFELGRHGYHYYSKKHILKILENSGFKKAHEYNAGGFVGFVFMLCYSWPRYIVLVPAVFIYHFLKYFNLTKKSWNEFSIKLVNSIFYFYHNSKMGVKIHNLIVSKVVELDNKFKIFPASYIFVLTK